MHAMQHEITLPGDYDMGIIRHRVARKGASTDSFGDLGLKAYAIRERGRDGSAVNQYAPFYLWAAPEGMNAFLWGPGFSRLSTDFGRPLVQHWTGLAFHPGPARGTAPSAATRDTQEVPTDADPVAVIDAVLEHARRYAVTTGVHSTAVAIDPSRWQLVHFTLWDGTPPNDAGIRYRVLHLSQPALESLPAGRHW